MPRFSSLAACAAAGLLAGCGGAGDLSVGSGTGPTGLYLAYGDVATGGFEVPECVASQVTAVLVFAGDGASNGDFSSRVTWTSSAPDTLYVSDGVTAGPDGVVVAAGSVIGLKPGQAQLTARFSEYSASASVEVAALAGLRIAPQLTDLVAELDQPFQLLLRPTALTAELDVTTAAQWSFARPTAIAAVGASTGVVSANSANAGESATLLARIPGCGREVSLPLRVSTPTALQVDYEQGSELRLPVGYSEALTVSARFAATDSVVQNLSSQIDIADVDDDLLAVSRGDEHLFVQAVDSSATATGFTLRLSDRSLSVASKRWLTSDTELLRVTLAPEDLRIRYPDTGLLVASGLFADGVTRPISRHVTWSSELGTVSVVSGVNDNAGTVSVPDAEVSTTIGGAAGVARDDGDDFVTVRGYAASSPDPNAGLSP
ncbi:MAG: hypothetical protein C0434_15990 [Xanthomonadaceae bacterium]|nr:hypothetical protein [Xanthomonadaceae bacterium]